MSRVPYLSRETAAVDDKPLWDRLEVERKVPTANIFRALANAPVLLDAFLSYANALRDGSALSPKLRELAILTVGHATDSEYEIAHHQSHGRKAGISREQLAAVAGLRHLGAVRRRRTRGDGAGQGVHGEGPGVRRHLGRGGASTWTTGSWSSSP